MRTGSTPSERKTISAGEYHKERFSSQHYTIFTDMTSTPTDTYLSTYTDDTMIGTRLYDLDTAITHLQTCINEFTDWLSKWKFTLNSQDKNLHYTDYDTTFPKFK